MGAERFYLIIVPAQVHPVGEQYYYLPEVQVNPKGDAGETEVAKAARGEEATAAGFPGCRDIKARGRVQSPAGASGRSAPERIKEIIGGASFVSLIKPGRQLEDFPTSAEEASMAGDTAGGPGIFVVNLAPEGAARNEADFGGRIVFILPARLLPGVKAQIFQT